MRLSPDETIFWAHGFITINLTLVTTWALMLFLVVGSVLITRKLKSGSSPVLVRSAYDLPKKQQTEIESAVKELLGGKTQFQFKTAPELISGIDLTSNGYKLAWSISEYLSSLKKSIEETMQETMMKEEPKKEPVKVPKEVPVEVPKEGPEIIPQELPEKN